MAPDFGILEMKCNVGRQLHSIDKKKVSLRTEIAPRI